MQNHRQAVVAITVFASLLPAPAMADPPNPCSAPCVETCPWCADIGALIGDDCRRGAFREVCGACEVRCGAHNCIEWCLEIGTGCREWYPGPCSACTPEQCPTNVTVPSEDRGCTAPPTDALLLIDHSGSMLLPEDGSPPPDDFAWAGPSGPTRWGAAVDAANALVGACPFVRWGLATFPLDGDQNGPCVGGQLRVEVGSTPAQIQAALEAAGDPSGSTPLTRALDEVPYMMRPRAGALPHVVLITDGGDSCGGHPQDAIRRLRTRGIYTIVVGFNIDPAREEILNIAAEEGGAPNPDDPYGRLYWPAESGEALRALVRDRLCAALRVEVCDNRDNNCDGETDEGVLRTAGPVLPCHVTPCGTVMPTCSDGHIVCPPAPDPSQFVEVFDCLDNDCDGATDEGLDPPSCGAPDATQDLCAPGHLSCNCGDPPCCVGSVTRPRGYCDPDVCADPVHVPARVPTICGMGVCAKSVLLDPCTETCPPDRPCLEICGNALDDDCDGTADESNCHPGRCVERLGSGCTIRSDCDEVCDGVDNDSNGQIDDVDPWACRALGAHGAVVEGRFGCGIDAKGFPTALCMGTSAEVSLGTSTLLDGCDGLDNDYDMAVDEDIAEQPSRRCDLSANDTTGEGAQVYCVTDCSAPPVLACAWTRYEDLWVCIDCGDGSRHGCGIPVDQCLPTWSGNERIEGGTCNEGHLGCVARCDGHFRRDCRITGDIDFCTSCAREYPQAVDCRYATMEGAR